MKFFYAIILSSSLLSAQVSLDKIGSISNEAHHCLSDDQRSLLIQETERIKKIYPINQKAATVSFIWPLRASEDYDGNDFYTVSNYVDHDDQMDDLLDYECGTRTYDLSNGYNHQGTDLFLWPFGWDMMEKNHVEVIAAAEGIILQKLDGNPDKNCDFSNPDWNAIQIGHPDGSSSWYGHLKKHSLTDKNVGDAVEAGEYLGVVGSSGYSTGPHLHFEVWNASNEVIDPFSGACNTSNSLWEEQNTYYDPQLNKIATHHDNPVLGECYNDEELNLRGYFQPGDTIYLLAYYRDLSVDEVSAFRIYRPNGDLYYQWNYSIPSGYYSAAYLSWFLPLPENAEFGMWNFEVELNGVTLNDEFEIIDSNVGIIENQPINISFHNGQLNFTEEISNIELFDLNGRRIESNNTSSATMQVSHIHNGVYFLRYQKQNHIFTQLIQINN